MRALAVQDLPAAGNVGNALAYLKDQLGLFWIGIYETIAPGQLGLSHFQGLAACTLIEFGKGVCGTSALEKRIIIVDDVSTFPGYIACHSQARSEIVVPFVQEGETIFVLDVDSDALSSFSNEDAAFYEEVCKHISQWVSK